MQHLVKLLRIFKLQFLLKKIGMILIVLILEGGCEDQEENHVESLLA